MIQVASSRRMLLTSTTTHQMVSSMAFPDYFSLLSSLNGTLPTDINNVKLVLKQLVRF